MTVASPSIELLTDVDSLAEQLADTLIVDTRLPEHHAAGHIPGAVSLPLRTTLMEDTSPHALRELGLQAQEALGARGISPDSRIVMVDDGDASSSVAVLIAELAGMTKASALFGGMDAWVRRGGAVETGDVETTPVAFSASVSMATVASIDDLQYGPHSGATLLDVRSQLEHEGIIGSPCCPSRGHIPGSLHLEWTSLLNPGGHVLDAERVVREAASIGLNQGDDIVVYCHSGLRSAVAALVLRSAGFTRVRNSLGSWHEWSHRGFPIAPTA